MSAECTCSISEIDCRTEWNEAEWSGIESENRKQLSLQLSVLVQTELHSVWQLFPISHNTRDFRTTIIDQSISSANKLNTYPPTGTEYINAVCHSKKNTCRSAASPNKTNSQQKNDAEKKIRMTYYQCDIVNWRCHHVTWSIHKMTSHGRTVTMALLDTVRFLPQYTSHVIKHWYSSQSSIAVHVQCHQTLIHQSGFYGCTRHMSSNTDTSVRFL